jgi:SAM-dependent methyltransferase
MTAVPPYADDLVSNVGAPMSTVKRDLFLASFLMLFTELALIRWLGENVPYLSYFTNFVLLASFLGIGLGFLTGDKDLGWFRWFGHLVLLTIGVVTVFPIRINRSAEEVLFLGSGDFTGTPLWVALPLIFTLAAAVTASVGHGVARLFRRLPALTAYRFDILGSIAGVLGFALLSLLRSPPLVWGVVIAVLFLLLSSRRSGTQILASAGFVLVLGIQTFNPLLQWSPYYEIIVADLDATTSISVNRIPHQAMAPLSLLDEIGWVGSQTFEFLEVREPEKVLIIGAGSGNDVALSLRAGAAHIDAVEIDPAIYEIGLEKHPENPYQSERVDVHIDDGRAFIERSEDQYDLILFALTDSLTVVSGQSSLRLESYLFTTEAVQSARERLADDGVLTLYNVHSDQWVIDRMGRTMQEVFGQRPCYRSEAGVQGTTLAVGATTSPCDPADRRDFSDGLEPSTDDLPFLYVQERSIPPLYVASIAAILATSALALRFAVRDLSSAARYTDLFFMGGAFLLLETSGIVRFALWFGTTWVVNALVFASILTSVILAIEVVERVRVPSLAVLYVLLAASLAILWAIPADTLLQLPFAPRLLAAGTLAFMPVFLANVIFAERFKDTSSSTTAFGANLLGAIVGGTLEYGSLVVGYRGMTLVVAALYALAFVSWRRLSSA